MSRLSLLHVAIVTSLVSIAPTAWSQSSPRSVAGIVSAGVAIPSGSFKEHHDLGFHAAVSALVRLSGQGLRLRPELSVSHFSIKEPIGVVVPLSVNPAVGGLDRTRGRTASAQVAPDDEGTSGASTLLSVLGNVELPLARGAYLVGGVGGTRVSSEANRSGDTVQQTALTYIGGAGVRFRLGGIAGFVEARWQNLSADDAKFSFTSVRTIPVTIGLVF